MSLNITRNTMTINVLSALLICVALHVVDSNSILKLDPTNIGVRMNGHLIVVIADCQTFYQCSERCTDLTNCVSINYSFKQKFCELNSAIKATVQPSEMVANPSFVYMDIASWPKQELNVCSAKPCSGTERCVQDGESRLCLNTDCPDPPLKISDANVTSGSISIGSVRKYVCPSGQQANGINTITCSGTSWSQPSFACIYVRNCSQMQKCNPNYSDGHYWLYPEPFGSSAVKVYCHGMDGDKPEEYITVHQNNFAKYGASDSQDIRLTNFDKIRIRIETMTVKPNDFTYTTQTGTAVNYGRAQSCTCAYSAQGSFRIDTTGTGLFIDPSLPWKKYGYGTEINNFARSEGGSVISAQCVGCCGRCDPDGPMVLHLKPTEVLDSSEAVWPYCP